ncbi:HNH endonuclease [Curtobacterium sp. Csp2]|uniref:HNH endonuclease signature motif containing protein n=1 Tax=Curtobacterium sp. Csp2 TaxID=2495430 RepID=UPI0015806E6B|nr:HNH endonuclease signature motif containing protein [Curtobacterium sp. Csp2]QKS15697.1 HNH endonuclease [Curtobacterium sp. Csp2]
MLTVADISEADAARFWSKVDKTNGCWIWRAAKNQQGYGRARVAGKYHTSHRVAWTLVMGEIEAGQVVDHICFNTSYVNPKHLRVASQKQNSEHLRGATVRSKTGIRGVIPSSQKVGKPYRVVVRHHGRKYYGGTFDDLHVAEQAAVRLRSELFTHADGR